MLCLPHFPEITEPKQKYHKILIFNGSAFPGWVNCHWSELRYGINNISMNELENSYFVFPFPPQGRLSTKQV